MTTNRENAYRLGNSVDTIQDNDSIYRNASVLSSGTLGSVYATSVRPPADVTIAFNGALNEPILKLEANGDIYVNGRLAANDLEVVEGMRQFLLEQGML